MVYPHNGGLGINNRTRNFYIPYHENMSTDEHKMWHEITHLMVNQMENKFESNMYDTLHFRMENVDQIQDTNSWICHMIPWHNDCFLKIKTQNVCPLAAFDWLKAASYLGKHFTFPTIYKKNFSKRFWFSCKISMRQNKYAPTNQNNIEQPKSNGCSIENLSTGKENRYNTTDKITYGYGDICIKVINGATTNIQKA